MAGAFSLVGSRVGLDRSARMEQDCVDFVMLVVGSCLVSCLGFFGVFCLATDEGISSRPLIVALS